MSQRNYICEFQSKIREDGLIEIPKHAQKMYNLDKGNLITIRIIEQMEIEDINKEEDIFIPIQSNQLEQENQL